MYFLFCALISILWGCLSPWLFLNGWLAFLGMIAVALAFFKGKLEFDGFLRNIFRAFSELMFNFILLGAGFYIIYRYYALGRTTSEVILYWIVASLQLCYLLSDISRKIDLLIEKSQQ